jgi:hypothetical protein
MTAYLGGGEDVFSSTEVDTLLSLLHSANQGARNPNPPAEIVIVQ